ncbi:hypothetical protein RRG08_003764 [Elysia crispata]|uniref:Uncharacterized protein n=1 Tax=Elysia crispata TaxID=231223 RepID=A0AAE1AVC7_9GAST|nr:hypothetical protein RRG08_003764 [Elysia crispata]
MDCINFFMRSSHSILFKRRLSFSTISNDDFLNHRQRWRHKVIKVLQNSKPTGPRKCSTKDLSANRSRGGAKLSKGKHLMARKLTRKQMRPPWCSYRPACD